MEFYKTKYSVKGSLSSLNYRYGYQGSEKDNEVNSSNGTSYTTEFRQLDTRLGRWFSSDPVFQPWQSSYTSMDNNPINLTDVDGDCTDCKTDGLEIGDQTTDKDGKFWSYWGKDKNGNAIWKLDFVQLEEITINATKKTPSEIFVEITLTVNVVTKERSLVQKFIDFITFVDDELKGKRAEWTIGVAMFNSKGEPVGDPNDLPKLTGGFDIEDADVVLDMLMAGKSGLEGLEKLAKLKKISQLPAKKEKISWNDFQKRNAGKYDPKKGHVTTQKAKDFKNLKKDIEDWNKKVMDQGNKMVSDLAKEHIKDMLRSLVESEINSKNGLETPMADLMDKVTLNNIIWITSDSDSLGVGPFGGGDRSGGGVYNKGDTIYKYDKSNGKVQWYPSR